MVVTIPFTYLSNESECALSTEGNRLKLWFYNLGLRITGAQKLYTYKLLQQKNVWKIRHFLSFNIKVFNLLIIFLKLEWLFKRYLALNFHTNTLLSSHFAWPLKWWPKPWYICNVYCDKVNVFLLVVLPSEPPRTESSASSRAALPEPNKNNYVIDLLSCKCNIQLW